MEKHSYQQYDKNNKYIARKEKTMCTQFVYRVDDTINGLNFKNDFPILYRK